MERRGILDVDQEKDFYRETTGFIGEKIIADILEKELVVKPLIIFDYRFEIDGNERQIDCLLIFQHECILIEVKNYTGEYLFDSNEMYFASNKERLEQQPFSQIGTTKSMLKKLFDEKDIRMKITEKIIFPNQDFYMYNDHRDLPTVYAATLSQFIDELNKKSCWLNDKHQNILQKLMSSRVSLSKYYLPIQCEFEVLKKGITCGQCEGWLQLNERKKLVCNTCAQNENFDTAIIRGAKEFSTLFPDKKITISVMAEWIDYKISRSTLYRILNKHLKAEGSYKSRYYLLEKDCVNENTGH